MWHPYTTLKNNCTLQLINHLLLEIKASSSTCKSCQKARHRRIMLRARWKGSCAMEQLASHSNWQLRCDRRAVRCHNIYISLRMALHYIETERNAEIRPSRTHRKRKIRIRTQRKRRRRPRETQRRRRRRTQRKKKRRRRTQRKGWEDREKPREERGEEHTKAKRKQDEHRERKAEESTRNVEEKADENAQIKKEGKTNAQQKTDETEETQSRR